jgi:surface polysaccharide O-acyltransferase-like enzyme
MIGVVWAHIQFLPVGLSIESFMTLLPHLMEFIAFMQVFKFGVICFFLISGYLLGDKILTSDPYEYFKRRFSVTVKPYMVVVSIIVIIQCIRIYLIHTDQPSVNFFTIVKNSILDGPLWYLPNYLVSLTVLLCFTKVIHKKWFGGILLAITLGYAIITVYNSEYSIPHTSAVFGFVFYLWLGAYIRQNNWINQIYKVKISILVIITLALFILSCLEAYYLFSHGNSQYFNVLRIANQLYSIAMFCLLVKISEKPIVFTFFNPREETFGIYLYHSIFIAFFLPKLNTFVTRYLQIDIYNMIYYSITFLCYFLLCYFSSLFAVRFLIKYNLGYIKLKK